MVTREPITPSLDGLAHDPSLIKGLPQSVVTSLYSDAAKVEALLRAYLFAFREPSPAVTAPVEEDRLLDAKETAERLGVPVGWIHRNWQTRLPFGRKVGRRSLRFSEQALRRYIEKNDQAHPA